MTIPWHYPTPSPVVGGGRRRGDGVPTAPAGIFKAEDAIFGLFQEIGLQDPQGVTPRENEWRHHGCHAFPGVDSQAASTAAVRGGLLIALQADVFAAEEVRDVVDILPVKVIALNVVSLGGTFTVIIAHGPGSGGDSWASKASFLGCIAMYGAAKSAGGTRRLLIGGGFNVWLDSPGHPTARQFVAPWEQCGFLRQETPQKKTGSPRVKSISWTLSCSTRRRSRGQFVSSRT